jgi:glycosyltransferase involved in cell wall biosynthesis
LVIIDGLAYGAMPALACAEGARLRLVALVHHPLALETGLEAAAASRLAESERLALQHARKVIVTSRSTQLTLAEHFGIGLERSEVVPPGTDAAPLASGSGTSSVALLCAATLIPRKGHALLFEALGTLRHYDWRLVCAGSDRLDPQHAFGLRRQLQRDGLETRVLLTGELLEQQLEERFARTDVFVLPTLYEGYGMSVAEALARGIPVVATATGALPEIVPPEAGILVAPGDRSALTAALARVLSEPQTRASLQRGARAARERLPDWQASCARFGTILDELGPV